MASDPIRVLYIGGYGRSGSTLVERALGQVRGFCAVGELRHLWERGLRDNQLCGCGEAFQACAFWRAVVKRGFGGFGQIDARYVVELARGVDRTRFIPALASHGSAAFEQRVDAYGAVLQRLYAAIRDVAGGAVIVDSSKEPSYAFLLRRIRGVDLRLLHLVRDSRAVAYSWLRKRARPEIYWTRAFMDVHTPVKSAVLWVLFNGLCHGLAARGCPARRLHYEDFIADPSTALRTVLTDLGDGVAPLDMVRDRSVTLAPNHTVSGNPLRFAVGEVEIRPDDEWRSDMAAGDRRLLTALTYPLLCAYGYTAGRRPGGPRAARDRAAVGSAQERR